MKVLAVKPIRSCKEGLEGPGVTGRAGPRLYRDFKTKVVSTFSRKYSLLKIESLSFSFMKDKNFLSIVRNNKLFVNL